MSSSAVVKNAIARLLLGCTQYNKVLLRSKYGIKGIQVVHASRSFPTAHSLFTRLFGITFKRLSSVMPVPQSFQICA